VSISFVIGFVRFCNNIILRELMKNDKSALAKQVEDEMAGGGMQNARLTTGLTLYFF
jgi:GH24 family phage-related lysozyme (muramidase)